MKRLPRSASPIRAGRPLLKFFSRRLVCTALLAVFCSIGAWAQAAKRTVQLLDKGWQFYPLPDFDAWPPTPELTEDEIKQLVIPASGNGWRPAQVPDDYVVRGAITENPNPALLAAGAACQLGERECAVPSGPPPARRPGQNMPRNAFGSHGYLPVYPAWYQRKILIAPSAKGKEIWIEFGGVFRDAIVFVNGTFIAQHPGGYTTFRLNITSAVHAGDNTVSVFVDPRWFEGWWYEGGGIYRHVRLVITDPLEVEPWGTFVTSTVEGAIRHEALGDRSAADLLIETTVRNDESAGQEFTLVSQVLDGSGKVMATVSSMEQVDARAAGTFKQPMKLREALLWSLKHPNLYWLRTTIRRQAAVLDETSTSFGIRALRFDPDQGFFLNGEHVEIYGVASHQDFPGIGIGAPDDLWSWRIQKLKAMGANAYRTAHNPLPEEFYEAADRLGMLVMDETRHLGDTYAQKATSTTPYSDLSDLKAMVAQHRNHPSIIMWSLANEEGQQRTEYGARIFAAMQDAVRELDPTRPTTSAMNGGLYEPGFRTVENILGVNYHSTEFDKIHQANPKLMIFGSEDVNAKTSRGTRAASRETGLCSAFGDDAPGGEPWSSWVPVAEHPFVAGQFIWTGFDYRGEPNPFSWPAVTSQTGAMDLCGFPKSVYHYWDMVWHQNPSVYVFPDWNHPENDIGQKVRVGVFANTEEVELELNGRSVGVEQVPRNQYVDWQVTYEPGTLTAIGRSKGSEVARYSVETTGAPAALRLIAEVEHPAADGEEIVPVRVEVLDSKGRVVPDADNLVRFTVSGAGTLAGVGNGNPASHESNVGDQRTAYRGLCMALVRVGEHPGAITVEARADRLLAAHLRIPTADAVTRR